MLWCLLLPAVLVTGALLAIGLLPVPAAAHGTVPPGEEHADCHPPPSGSGSRSGCHPPEPPGASRLFQRSEHL